MDIPNTDAATPAVTPAAAPAAAPAITPGEMLNSQIPGDTPEAKIDALHQKHFVGSALASDTAAWNLVMAYTADIKRLWAELQAAVEKL